MGAVDDPLLQNAQDDLDALAKKLGTELHEQDEHVGLKQKFLEILTRYGPSLAEAAIRVALSLAGVPAPPVIGGAPPK